MVLSDLPPSAIYVWKMNDPEPIVNKEKRLAMKVGPGTQIRYFSLCFHYHPHNKTNVFPKGAASQSSKIQVELQPERCHPEMRLVSRSNFQRLSGSLPPHTITPIDFTQTFTGNVYHLTAWDLHTHVHINDAVAVIDLTHADTKSTENILTTTMSGPEPVTPFDHEVLIYPGDSLHLSCTYNNSLSREVLIG